MVKVTCTEYTNCPHRFDDGQEHDIESLENFVCPLKDQAGICGIQAVERTSWTDKVLGPLANLPQNAKMGALIAVGVAALGGAAWALRGPVASLFGPSCDIAQAKSLLTGDSKVGDLDDVGSGCLERGIRDGDVDKIEAGTVVLRAASDRKSPDASWQLGRLFDPLMRAELEEIAAVPTLLPAPDAGQALAFYEKAGSLKKEAVEAAAALRRRYPELSVRATGKGGQPLQIAGHAGLAQRVLTKPGATLHASPNSGAAGTPLPPLSTYYVFERRPGWARIGPSIGQASAGWVAEAQVENWNVMLVMKYAPVDNREPALFLRDELSVKSLLNDPGSVEAIAEMRRSTTTSTPDPRVVAIEDRTVDWANSPYLMPILRTSSHVTDGGRTVYLAEVASVAGGAGAIAPGSGAGMSCRTASTSSLVHQVVFVIDTTISMGPYIAGVRDIAGRWADEVARLNVGEKFRFGVIGYRNNMDAEPQRSGLQYVTEEFLPLAPTSDAAALKAAMGKIQPAKVSTHSFDEDAVAGLDRALKLNWGDACGARFIVLVTDAGALASTDPKASLPGVGLSTIAADANKMDISIFPVHIQTKEARAARNIESAAAQYRTQLDDGRGQNPYRSIPNGSTRDFATYLSSFGKSIPVFRDEKENKGLSRDKFAKAPDGDNKLSVEQLVLGKIFAAQQRYIGQAAGATAPTFTASWTSDRDLTNPNVVALDVNVLLTRQQLNQLAEQCRTLVDNARQNNSSSADFFKKLRVVSAATAQDPKRFANSGLNLEALLPSFLGLLPYKSEVLKLDEVGWRSKGATSQLAFINRLEEKISYYRRLNNDGDSWLTLSNGEQVAQIPLREMP